MDTRAFAAHTIRDEQLRMMFSCCHPRLAEEAQVALVLNILCGFGASEIAAAFLAGRGAVEKRIVAFELVAADEYCRLLRPTSTGWCSTLLG